MIGWKRRSESCSVRPRATCRYARQAAGGIAADALIFAPPSRPRLGGAWEDASAWQRRCTRQRGPPRYCAGWTAPARPPAGREPPMSTPIDTTTVWTPEAIRQLGMTTDVATAGAILGIG